MTHIYTQLEVVITDIMTRWGIPGVGVGLVDNGEIVYARGFGVQSLETRAPFTPDSLFCMASVAKCFVACAILQLVEQGRLELDAPLVQYLPYFRLDDPRYPEITLRQMLSHTSGFPDMDEVEYEELVARPETDDGAAERYVRSLSNRKMIAAPGERFAYSNIAYNVLGDLIAKTSGQTFEAYLRERILRPAGMPDSTFLLAEIDRACLVLPHLRIPEMVVNPIYPYHRADGPSSFLHASVVEMCHWAITSLQRGRYQGERILSPASYDLMWKPVARRNYPPWRETMGLGWALGHFEGLETVSHGGAGFGWTCSLVLFPEVNQAAVILCNEESSAHERVLQAAVQALLGKNPQPGRVSWMIPITRALQSGGLPAALARYAEIKDSPDYEFDPYDLESLVYQLLSVQKLELAIDVLKLNLQVFPDDLDSYHSLAQIYIKTGDRARAEAILQTALAKAPGNLTFTRMLAEIQAPVN